MAQPKTLVLTGYGINCDEETRYAFEYAGSDADIIHVNDLIEKRGLLKQYQIMVFPGGFSYGDDTGSGKALANRIKNNLLSEINEFINRDTLVLGICNGFQVMVNIGLVPAMQGFTGNADVALEHNRSYRYQCRWVDLNIEKESPSVFTRGIDTMHIPVAHGEGNFYASQETLDGIERNKLVAMRYFCPDGSPAQGVFPCNPNGSINDIAAVSDRSGRVMGMMPHPERGMFFLQRDDWTLIREEQKRKGIDMQKTSDGMVLFTNAVAYFE